MVSPVVGASSSSRLVIYSHFGSKGGKHNSMKNAKTFTFQIQKLHRSEVLRWKTQVCSNLLRSTTNWAALKRVSQQGRAHTKGADVAVDDFAENLETLFHGDADQPAPPNNRRCGRPPFAWDEKVRAFFRWKQLGDWKETSAETWHRFESEFVAFITGR